MQFWHSAKVLLCGDDPSVGPNNCKYELVGSRRIDGNEFSVDKIGEINMVMVNLCFWSLLYQLYICHAILLLYLSVIVINFFSFLFFYHSICQMDGWLAMVSVVFNFRIEFPLTCVKVTIQ